MVTIDEEQALRQSQGIQGLLQRQRQEEQQRQVQAQIQAQEQAQVQQADSRLREQTQETINQLEERLKYINSSLKNIGQISRNDQAGQRLLNERDAIQNLSSQIQTAFDRGEYSNLDMGTITQYASQYAQELAARTNAVERARINQTQNQFLENVNAKLLRSQPFSQSEQSQLRVLGYDPNNLVASGTTRSYGGGQTGNINLNQYINQQENLANQSFSGKARQKLTENYYSTYPQISKQEEYYTKVFYGEIPALRMSGVTGYEVYNPTSQSYRSVQAYLEYTPSQNKEPSNKINKQDIYNIISPYVNPIEKYKSYGKLAGQGLQKYENKLSFLPSVESIQGKIQRVKSSVGNKFKNVFGVYSPYVKDTGERQFLGYNLGIAIYNPPPSPTIEQQDEVYNKLNYREGKPSSRLFKGLGTLGLGFIETGKDIITNPESLLLFPYQVVTKPLSTGKGIVSSAKENPLRFTGQIIGQIFLAKKAGQVAKPLAKKLTLVDVEAKLKSGETIALERGLSIEEAKRVVSSLQLKTKGKFEIKTRSYLGVRVGKGSYYGKPLEQVPLLKGLKRGLEGEKIKGAVFKLSSDKIQKFTRTGTGKEIGTVVTQPFGEILAVVEKNKRQVVYVRNQYGDIVTIISNRGKITFPTQLKGIPVDNLLKLKELGSQQYTGVGAFTNKVSTRGRPPKIRLQSKDVLYGAVDVGKGEPILQLYDMYGNAVNPYAKKEIIKYPTYLLGTSKTKLRSGKIKTQITTVAYGQGEILSTQAQGGTALELIKIKTERPDIVKYITRYVEPNKNIGVASTLDNILFSRVRKRVLSNTKKGIISVTSEKKVPIKFKSLGISISDKDLFDNIKNEREVTFSPKLASQISDVEVLKSIKRLIKSREAFQSRISQLSTPGELFKAGTTEASKVATKVGREFAKTKAGQISTGLSIPVTLGNIKLFQPTTKVSEKIQSKQSQTPLSDLFLQQKNFLMPKEKQTQKETQQQKQNELQKQVQKQKQVQIQIQNQIQIQKQSQIQKQVQQQQQKQIQQQIQKQVQLQKQVQIQKQVQLQKQVQIQKQVQLQKQVQIQIQIQKQIQKQPPRTPPPVFPKGFLKTSSSLKNILNKVQAYNLFVKRYGKERLVASGLPFGKATRQGALSLKQTLGATARLSPSGFTSQEDVSFNLSPEFRTYRIVKGQRVNTPLQFIQNRGYRLGTRSEREEIQFAKKSKRRVKTAKWF